MPPSPPAPPSLPPSLPPPPPLAPGERLRQAVEIALVLGGSVETFDQGNFTTALAASVGVQAADISLDVRAASILVVATIAVANASEATDLASTLTTATSNASAFGALLGVTVERIEPPVVKTTVLAAPASPPSPPPSAPPPPAGPSRDELLDAMLEQAEDALDDPGVRLAMAAAIALVLALVGWRLCKKRAVKAKSPAQKAEGKEAKREEVTVLVDPVDKAKPLDLAKVERALEKEAGRKTARSQSNGAYHSLATAEAAPAKAVEAGEAKAGEAKAGAAAAASGAKEQTKWYYGDVVSNQPKGPVSAEEIKTMVAEGVLNSGTQVWNDSLPSWVPLAHAPELRTGKSPVKAILKPDLKAAASAVAASNAIKTPRRRRVEGEARRRVHREEGGHQEGEEGEAQEKAEPLRRAKSAPRVSRSPAIDAQHHWLQQQLREGDLYDEYEAPKRATSAPRERTAQPRSPSGKDTHHGGGKPAEHLTEVKVDRSAAEPAAGRRAKSPGELDKRDPTRRKRSTDAALTAVAALAALQCGSSEEDPSRPTLAPTPTLTLTLTPTLTLILTPTQP